MEEFNYYIFEIEGNTEINKQSAKKFAKKVNLDLNYTFEDLSPQDMKLLLITKEEDMKYLKTLSKKNKLSDQKFIEKRIENALEDEILNKEEKSFTYETIEGSMRFKFFFNYSE